LSNRYIYNEPTTRVMRRKQYNLKEMKGIRGKEEIWRDNQIIEMSTNPEFLSILSLTKEISMNSIDDFGS
jgi:hypothetical protein